MSTRKHLRLRILTGLHRCLDESTASQAIRHWDQHYTERPGGNLREFVFEIAREGELRSRRSEILLHLVDAMKTPDSAFAQQGGLGAGQGNESAESTAAFKLFMMVLMKRLSRMQQHYLRLDLLGSLDRRKHPAVVIDAIKAWLNEGHSLDLPPVSPVVLRALVNRTYVVMCERIGPVDADQVLAEVTNLAQRKVPRLDRALTELL